MQRAAPPSAAAEDERNVEDEFEEGALLSSADAAGGGKVEAFLAGPFGQFAYVVPFFSLGSSLVALSGTTEVAMPVFLAGSSLFPAGLLGMAQSYVQKRRLVPGWRAAPALAAFTLLDGVAFQLAIVASLSNANPGVAALFLNSTAPLFTIALSAVLFGERLPAKGAAGLVVALVGLAGLMLGDPSGGGAGPEVGGSIADLLQRGEVWALIAAAFMASGTALIRYVARHMDVFVAVAWHNLLAGSLLLSASAIIEGGAAYIGLGATDWACIAYNSVFGYYIGASAYFFLAERGSIVKLSTLSFLTPVVAAGLGWVLLGEKLAPWQAAGFAVTLVGITLTSWALAKQEEEQLV